MKKLQYFFYMILFVVLSSSCNSTQNKEKHTHSKDCNHIQTADTTGQYLDQETFTVEIDSLKDTSDDSTHEHKTNKKTHRHADGSEHTN